MVTYKQVEAWALPNIVLVYVHKKLKTDNFRLLLRTFAESFYAMIWQF